MALVPAIRQTLKQCMRLIQAINLNTYPRKQIPREYIEKTLKTITKTIEDRAKLLRNTRATGISIGLPESGFNYDCHRSSIPVILPPINVDELETRRKALEESFKEIPFGTRYLGGFREADVYDATADSNIDLLAYRVVSGGQQI